MLVTHFFSVDQPMPGRYNTNEKLYNEERDCGSGELEMLVCFNLQENIEELKRSKMLFKMKQVKGKLAAIPEEREKKRE